MSSPVADDCNRARRAGNTTHMRGRIDAECEPAHDRKSRIRQRRPKRSACAMPCASRCAADDRKAGASGVRPALCVEERRRVRDVQQRLRIRCVSKRTTWLAGSSSTRRSCRDSREACARTARTARSGTTRESSARLAAKNLCGSSKCGRELPERFVRQPRREREREPRLQVWVKRHEEWPQGARAARRAYGFVMTSVTATGREPASESERGAIERPNTT